jgi:hypothetical protein
MSVRQAPCGLGVVLVGLALMACGHKPVRQLRGASRSLGDDIAASRSKEVVLAVVPGKRNAVDLERLVGRERRTWAKALRRPVAIHPEALVLVAPDWPTKATFAKDGWTLGEDPLDVYAQDTPRAALRALVYASRLKRWDVLLELAPRRYRIGLSVDDLERAWTQGAHVFDPIFADEHEAVLELGASHVARLEREGDRWVVVDFLPEQPVSER